LAKSGFNSGNGVINSEFLFFDFGFGGATNLDDGDFAAEGSPACF